MKHKMVLLFAALILLPGQVSIAKSPRYTLTVLPLTVDSPTGKGHSLNDKGQVVGSARNGAMIWQKGKPLRSLNLTSQSDMRGYPVSINDKGQVIGQYYFSTSGAYTITEGWGFLWQKGQTETFIGVPGDEYGSALALNNRGEVVGTSNKNANPMQHPDIPPDTNAPHAFLFNSNNDQMTNLGLGVAYGINDAREIVGTSGDAAVLWRKSGSAYLRTDLGAGEAYAINHNGWIVGVYKDLRWIAAQHTTQYVCQACLWHNGDRIILSRQLSYAHSLNNQGQIVGNIETRWMLGQPNEHAVLWQRGQTYDLNRCVSLPKSWNLNTATGINDKGWIVGIGAIYKNPKAFHPKRVFTFLLTPK